MNSINLTRNVVIELTDHHLPRCYNRCKDHSELGRQLDSNDFRLRDSQGYERCRSFGGANRFGVAWCNRMNGVKSRFESDGLLRRPSSALLAEIDYPN